MALSLSAAIVYPLHLALLLLLAVPLHPYMVVAQLTSRRSNLTAGGDTLSPPGYITSPSGDFAFGFRALGSTNPSGFLLAVWFRFDGTVVWFATDAAGSAVVVAAQSVLSVSTTGLVSLSNPGGNNPLWPSSNYAVSSLVLNDTGNLQFISGAGGNSIVWESFLYPADTLLPGQSMRPGTKLQSRSADMGFSLGDFSFVVQNDGNIVMYMMDVAGDSGEPNDPYWSTGTCCAVNSTTLFFDVEPAAHLYYTLTNGRERNLTTPQPLISTSAGLYQRATLDADGLLRVYIHPKNTGGGKGNDTWSVRKKIPEKVCKTVTDGRRGMCGPNSYCVELNEERINCECPDGYVFVDPQIRYKGCTPEFLPNSCDGKNHTAEFELEDLPKTNWVSSVSYRMHTFITEEQCRRFCLNSCSCAAALFDGNNCSEVHMLLAGWQDNRTTMRTLIKVRVKKTPVQILPYVLMAVFAVLFLATTCILVYCCITSKKQTRINSLSTRIFTRKELHRATKGFSELLGQGSFGKVYRGTVKSLQPPDVAVKDLGGCMVQQEKDFENEVGSIGQIHHRNLVRMIGYCKEGEHRMLVFEYMQGGTLADFITRSERPPWNLLAEAAIGIAKGMEYLHEGCKSKIIHCDIKPDNILFDDKQIPRITDFGIAKLLGDQKTQKTVNQTIAGTMPYMAPEWYDGRDKVDSKVDVYSFGVVLLEIVCCKRAMGEQPADQQVPSTMFPLTAWVESSIRGGKAELLAGGEIEALTDMESVERFARVAIWCLQRDPSARPTMRKVVQMLEGDLKVDPLPDA